MRIRDARESDYETLKSIYQQNGFDYELPQLDDFNFVVVIVDDDDRPRVAVPVRKFAELFFLCDRSWETPAWRLEAIRKLHAVMESRLSIRGFKEATCWLDPKISRSFGRKLMNLFGWKKQLWDSFTKEVRRYGQGR